MLTASFLCDRELEEAGLSLRWLRCDGQERKNLKGMIQTGGYYGCDYCPAKGENMHSARMYPFDCCHGLARRTTDGCRDIALNLEQLDTDGREGIQVYSPLLDVPGFDYVFGVPLDSMHNSDEVQWSTLCIRNKNSNFSLSTTTNNGQFLHAGHVQKDDGVALHSS